MIKFYMSIYFVMENVNKINDYYAFEFFNGKKCVSFVLFGLSCTPNISFDCELASKCQQLLVYLDELLSKCRANIGFVYIFEFYTIPNFLSTYTHQLNNSKQIPEVEVITCKKIMHLQLLVLFEL